MHHGMKSDTKESTFENPRPAKTRRVCSAKDTGMTLVCAVLRVVSSTYHALLHSLAVAQEANLHLFTLLLFTQTQSHGICC